MTVFTGNKTLAVLLCCTLLLLTTAYLNLLFHGVDEWWIDDDDHDGDDHERHEHLSAFYVPDSVLIILYLCLIFIKILLRIIFLISQKKQIYKG